MNEVIEYLSERFGIPTESLKGKMFYEASKGRIFMGPKVPDVDPVSIGILVARRSGAIKPSTNLVQIIGSLATRNFIDLNKDQAIEVARGDDLELSTHEASDGYVILTYQGMPMGCGLLKDNSVKNMIPKARRMSIGML